ncbi:hypothetical protein [Azospirillum rugosum]|uniref:Uncharacterized protein n=1 Tax=Azospirillum rugosum TaxID=416170 RepID=A0ABS4SEQ3_9PROT|nr:hypothetical protein [Azospirillum rugosum]MBP2291054.1 hypothetical protein [Azospirillum rugosum]MDQ0524882.1 hypothetical protein [Azospirillum rugosum]
MRLPRFAIPLALGGSLISAPPLIAWADDSWLTVADKSVDVLGASSDPVKMVAIVAVVFGLLIGWTIWLRQGRAEKPADDEAGAHTVDELFALVNSLSERIEGLTERMDRHLEQHAVGPASACPPRSGCAP